MRVITPQIVWHNKGPILTIDFDPTARQVGGEGFYRVATGGMDTHLLVWHLTNPDTFEPQLTCVADLQRHTKPINVVRFSPDGNYMASADDDPYIIIWQLDKTSKPMEFGDGFDGPVNIENWVPRKSLRVHLQDVTDIAWSSDCTQLATCSTDNSATLIDLTLDRSNKIKGTPIHVWNDHNGLVQGVAFDPQSRFVATMSTDRNLRVFETTSGHLLKKTSKYPGSWLSKDGEGLDGEEEKKENEPQPKKKEIVIDLEAEEQGEGQPGVNGEAGAQKTPKPPAPPLRNRLFHDDTLKTFCRRLTFSPKGEFLIVPGGILPPQFTGDDPSVGPGVPATPKAAEELCKTLLTKKKEPENCAIVFSRNSFTIPCALIPTGASYSIAIRFCPLYFKRKVDQSSSRVELENSKKKGERIVSCVGNLNITDEKNNILDMPYRLVFAILTNDSVLICDTISSLPLARVRNIHLARHSDLNWSPDGGVLVVSSNDGYCSIITFAPGELGEPYPMEEWSEAPAHAFPIKPKTIVPKLQVKQTKLNL